MHDTIIAFLLLAWSSINFCLTLWLYREGKRVVESRRIADLWLKLATRGAKERH